MIRLDEVPNEIAATGFVLPHAYRRVGELGLTNLEPWYFVAGEEARKLYEGHNKRYPQRLVLPFARRKDCDDVAVFVARSEGHAAHSVLIVHDYASPGFELTAALPSFWDWFRRAIEDLIEWNREGAEGTP